MQNILKKNQKLFSNCKILDKILTIKKFTLNQFHKQKYSMVWYLISLILIIKGFLICSLSNCCVEVIILDFRSHIHGLTVIEVLQFHQEEHPELSVTAALQ